MSKVSQVGFEKIPLSTEVVIVNEQCKHWKLVMA